MNALSRKAFNALLKAYCRGYNVTNVTEEFSLEPSVEQKLQDKIVEKSTFLPQINVLPVSDLKGETVLGSVNGPVAGRTDTSEEGKERIPRDMLGLDANKYELFITHSDVYMRHKTIDVWSKFPDFHDRYTSNVQERIANDRELVGWYGERVADNTDIKANPLLQDVNKGWMQWMRDKKPANILSTGKKEVGEIRIGPGGDYETLDIAVNDLLQGIPKWKRKGVVALIGDELIARERGAIFNAVKGTPTEKNAMNTAMAKIGGLDWDTPSNFPGRGLVITSLKNLSIYWQESSWRRHIKDKPEKERVEDYNARYEGYVVEDAEQFIAVEFKNVKVPGATAGEWI
jgi:P2 family phage major capsid protein